MRVRPAMPWALASAGAELFGGLGVAVGLLTPLAPFAIIATQLVAIALIHISHGFWTTKGGYEYNLGILAAMIAVAIAGPGAYSLDGLLGIKFPQPVTFLVLAALTILGVGAALLTRAPQEAPASRTKTA
jgi:putative oxidoreductase